MAPVSNVIGIAFNLKDPDNIIGKSGITVALIESGQPGLLQETFHNPNNAGFPKRTIKGEITIKQRWFNIRQCRIGSLVGN